MAAYARELVEDAVWAGRPLTVISESLTRVPHRGLAAFAARCADRVAVLSPQQKDRVLFAKAVEIAYCFAGGETSSDHRELLGKINRAVYSCSDNAVSESALSAIAALVVSSTSPAEGPLLRMRAADAAEHAVSAATFSNGPSAYRVLREAVRSDLDCLRGYIEKERLTDQSSVHADIFGALWPAGPPAGWPVR